LKRWVKVRSSQKLEMAGRTIMGGHNGSTRGKIVVKGFHLVDGVPGKKIVRKRVRRGGKWVEHQNKC